MGSDKVKQVIVDFDNTMGVPGCDVDDGLALLYLLGCDDVSIHGVCTTYGNNTLTTVHETTERMLDLLKLDAPLLRGLEGPLTVTDPNGAETAVVADARTTRKAAITPEQLHAAAAPRFIADELAAHPGELHVLATGSTTNLGAADLLRPDALADAASLTMMGGITRTLVINGRIMDELNLSCDPRATCIALATADPVAIATSQNCLPAFFTREDLATTFGEASWIYRTCDQWFATMDAAYRWKGWTCWDVVAAAHLVHPELFRDHVVPVTLYERLLSVGYLECDCPDAPHAMVNLPVIRDAAAFKEHVLKMWQRGLRKAGLA